MNNLNIREVRATAKNQAYLSADKSLSLRGRRLSSEDCPPKLLFVEIRPFSSHFTDLDISHSVDCTWNTIEAFLVALTNLQSFTATSCYLVDPEFTPSWPSKLLSLDLSRNKLTNCPGGLESLLQLKYLSLSGNRIHSITAELLRLASLKVLRLTSNPLEYPPKCVVQKGVHAMRKYWNISLLHHPSSSSDPGYSSNEEVAETESDCVFTTMADSNSNSPRFTSSSLPSHYANVHSVEHCEVFVPDACKSSVDIRVSVLKDHSYNPPLQSGIFLACPVICVEPHGMQFSSDSPAILVIPHCIDMSDLRHINLTPMCSNTGARQPPEWTTSKDTAVDVFDNCIMLTTSHFSFFTVVMQHSPPSSTVSILPAAGGVVTVPELPGFKVSLPPHALSGHEHQEIKATISYSTPPCCSVSAADSGSLASVCVGLEPHGTTFVKPVTVCIPIPDFAEISQHFRTHLVLLYSEFRGDDLPLEWQEFKEDVTISNTGMDLYTASFQVSHFSWWKFLWSVPQFFLRPFYRGVVSTYQGFRVMRLSVHCQVLMSPPIPDRTFGLAIAVYKFGDPLQSMANYKWIVADSGQNKRFLKTGPIEIKLTGNFEPIREFEGNDLIKRIDYTGEDFFEEFALKLKDDIVLPLQDHQVLGKLVIREINEDQIRQISLNIIKVRLISILIHLLCISCQSTYISSHIVNALLNVS